MEQSHIHLDNSSGLSRYNPLCVCSSPHRSMDGAFGRRDQRGLDGLSNSLGDVNYLWMGNVKAADEAGEQGNVKFKQSSELSTYDFGCLKAFQIKTHVPELLISLATTLKVRAGFVCHYQGSIKASKQCTFG